MDENRQQCEMRGFRICKLQPLGCQMAKHVNLKKRCWSEVGIHSRLLAVGFSALHRSLQLVRE